MRPIEMTEHFIRLVDRSPVSEDIFNEIFQVILTTPARHTTGAIYYMACMLSDYKRASEESFDDLLKVYQEAVKSE